MNRKNSSLLFIILVFVIIIFSGCRDKADNYDDKTSFYLQRMKWTASIDDVLKDKSESNNIRVIHNTGRFDEEAEEIILQKIRYEDIEGYISYDFNRDGELYNIEYLLTEDKGEIDYDPINITLGQIIELNAQKEKYENIEFKLDYKKLIYCIDKDLNTYRKAKDNIVVGAYSDLKEKYGDPNEVIRPDKDNKRIKVIWREKNTEISLISRANGYAGEKRDLIIKYERISPMENNELIKDIEKDYKIIRFIPEDIKYEAKSISNFDYAVDYSEVDIPMGKSRIGGPVVDLPKDVEYPTELYFVAQINLNEFKDYFINDYLPNKGFLYFFCDDHMENGRVIYSESTVDGLKRVVKEHDNQFFQGCLVKDIYIETENINERYDEEWAKEGEKVGWNPFIGFEKSKLFGLYNNCQYEEEEIKKELASTKILLLQIGEDFTEEGILSVRIEEKDLLNRKFENCIFEWSQS